MDLTKSIGIVLLHLLQHIVGEECKTGDGAHSFQEAALVTRPYIVRHPGVPWLKGGEEGGAYDEDPADGVGSCEKVGDALESTGGSAHEEGVQSQDGDQAKTGAPPSDQVSARLFVQQIGSNGILPDQTLPTRRRGQGRAPFQLLLKRLPARASQEPERSASSDGDSDSPAARPSNETRVAIV